MRTKSDSVLLWLIKNRVYNVESMRFVLPINYVVVIVTQRFAFYQTCLYFLEFPAGCSSYHGPHNLKCFQSIWTTSGCTEKGVRYPTEMNIFLNSSKPLASLRYSSIGFCFVFEVVVQNLQSTFPLFFDIC